MQNKRRVRVTIPALGSGSFGPCTDKKRWKGGRGEKYTQTATAQYSKCVERGHIVQWTKVQRLAYYQKCKKHTKKVIQEGHGIQPRTNAYMGA